MECNQYIFPLPEIEYMIFQYLDPIDDYKNVMLVSKYYFNLLVNNSLHVQLKDYYTSKKFVNHLLDNETDTQYYEENHKDFYDVCCQGQIDIAKYIYKKYDIKFESEKIDDIDFGNFTLNSVRNDGHLEIAKWLKDRIKKKKMELSKERESKLVKEN
jgi:hypothetical protein